MLKCNNAEMQHQDSYYVKIQQCRNATPKYKYAMPKSMSELKLRVLKIREC